MAVIPQQTEQATLSPAAIDLAPASDSSSNHLPTSKNLPQRSLSKVRNWYQQLGTAGVMAVVAVMFVGVGLLLLVLPIFTGEAQQEYDSRVEAQRKKVESLGKPYTGNNVQYFNAKYEGYQTQQRRLERMEEKGPIGETVYKIIAILIVLAIGIWAGEKSKSN